MFDIVKGTGSIIFNSVREMDDIKSIMLLELEKSVLFVGELLKVLRNEIGNEVMLFGFCGVLFMLVFYIVEGGTSSYYKVIKKMVFDLLVVYEVFMNKFMDVVIEYMWY